MRWNYQSRFSDADFGYPSAARDNELFADNLAPRLPAPQRQPRAKGSRLPWIIALLCLAFAAERYWHSAQQTIRLEKMTERNDQLRDDYLAMYHVYQEQRLEIVKLEVERDIAKIEAKVYRESYR